MKVLQQNLPDAAACAAYARDGRVQVSDFLTPAMAEAVAEALVDRGQWHLSYGPNAQGVHYRRPISAENEQEAQAAMVERLRHRQGNTFGKIHDTYAPWSGEPVPTEPRALLAVNALMAIVSGPVFRNYLQVLCAEPALHLNLVRATRYRPGHFLSRHDDKIRLAGKTRALAFVLNLSRDWQADWGGLLLFENAAHQATQVMHPLWNSLSVFRVPQTHSVTQVAPWAQGSRLALSGWMFRGAPQPVQAPASD